MFKKLIYPVLNLYWKVFQPKTFGARVMIISENKILLVKHSYIDGWYLPGGALKKKEQFQDGAIREVLEETSLQVKNLNLLGTYQNISQGKESLNIIFFTKQKVNENEIKQSNETKEIKLFNLTNLPKDISPGTLRRVNEYKNKDYPKVGIW